MFPSPAGSPRTSSSLLSDSVWFLSFFIFSVLLHSNTFIYTSNTAGVLVCYHYTWAFAPSIVNLELRCGMYRDGHTTVSHPFWFWLVSAYAMQLLIVFNINSNLLLSSAGQKEGAQKFLMILELWKTELWLTLQPYLTLLFSRSDLTALNQMGPSNISSWAGSVLWQSKEQTYLATNLHLFEESWQVSLRVHS